MRFSRFSVISLFLIADVAVSRLHAARMMEKLGCGVIAVPEPDGKVFISWRLFATDPVSVACNICRTTEAAPHTDFGRFGSRLDGQSRPDLPSPSSIRAPGKLG